MKTSVLEHLPGNFPIKPLALLGRFFTENNRRDAHRGVFLENSYATVLIGELFSSGIHTDFNTSKIVR